MPDLTAKQFVTRLAPLSSRDHVKKAQPHLEGGPKDRSDIDVSIGARMGDVFALAKEFTDMPLDEVEARTREDCHHDLMSIGAASTRWVPRRRPAASAPIELVADRLLGARDLLSSLLDAPTSLGFHFAGQGPP
jgi:hypothetical protein